jgi:uncharacterized protein (TIGR02246 family)
MTIHHQVHAEHDAAIRALEGEYDAAWNRGDVVRLGALYHGNAVVINPLGEVALGRPAIQAALRTFLQGVGRGSRHSTTVARISYVSDDVAVVDGEAHLEGARHLSSGTISHVFTDIVVRDGGRWFLVHTRAYVYASWQGAGS